MQQAVDQGSEKKAKEATSLLDVAGLATLLNVPKSWVYDKTRRKKGGIPRYKVGKYCRFDQQEVLDWIRKGNTVLGA